MYVDVYVQTVLGDVSLMDTFPVLWIVWQGTQAKQMFCSFLYISVSKDCWNFCLFVCVKRHRSQQEFLLQKLEIYFFYSYVYEIKCSWKASRCLFARILF